MRASGDRSCERLNRLLVELCHDGFIRLGRLGHFAVTDVADHFEDFTPSGELASTAPLVIIHGLHEFDFIRAIVPFTGRGINLATAFDFPAIRPRVGHFCGDTAVFRSSASTDNQFLGSLQGTRHEHCLSRGRWNRDERKRRRAIVDLDAFEQQSFTISMRLISQSGKKCGLNFRGKPAGYGRFHGIVRLVG